METYKAKGTLLKLIEENLVGTPDDADLLEAKAMLNDLPYVTKSDIIYMLQRGDAEEYAGRKLTADELDAVQKGVESGMGECWTTIMQTAVDEAVKDPELDHDAPETEAEQARTKVFDGKTYVFAWEQMVEPTEADLKRQSKRFYGGQPLIAERITDEPGSMPFSRVWVLKGDE